MITPDMTLKSERKMNMRVATIVVLAIALAGCASQAPTLDTSEGAEMSFDGLYPVQKPRADQAWARPDVDLTQYSKIMLQSTGIEYRPGGESGRTYMSRTHADHFEVTDRQKAWLLEIVNEKFREELGKSEHFALVTEPGPDVLLIRGKLLDVVSFAPPQESLGARESVYLSRIGEATLVVELRDSITEAILARAVDRRAAESAFELRESNRVTNAQEVRRLAAAWARLLRDRLDEYGAPAG